MREKVMVTSGNFSSSTFSAFSCIAIEASSPMLVVRIMCVAKEPSSSCGTNSAPSREKTKTARAKSATDSVTITQRACRAQSSAGR